jgi:DNA modification methylase
MKDFQTRNVNPLIKEKSEYRTSKTSSDNFDLYLGDCVDVASSLPSDSVDYSIFSPPFASLYTYSNSDRDMGNSKSYQQFWDHFGFLVKELNRVMVPGRNISVHCMNLPTSKVRDGYIGIRDFRGDIIRLFQSHGFIYHSEVCVWKNPVVAMQRTKALGLLWKQIKKDSAMSRQGIPDYVLTFRKKGVNPKPITHTPDQFGVNKWQKYASPCWIDINQSNTLNFKLARDKEDERHICPLQLDLIERCMELWSMPGDVVFSPFSGIGSEGYVAITKGRKYIGSELKESYFKLSEKHLLEAEKLEQSLWEPIYSKNPFDVSDFKKMKDSLDEKIASFDENTEMEFEDE